MLGLIWIQSIYHSDGPERNLKKNQQMTKKHEKFPRVQRVNSTYAG